MVAVLDVSMCIVLCIIVALLLGSEYIMYKMVFGNERPSFTDMTTFVFVSICIVVQLAGLIYITLYLYGFIE